MLARRNGVASPARSGLRDFDPFFDDFFRGVATIGAGLEPRRATFPMNVYGEDDALVVEAELPGVAEDNIDITMTGDTLTIRASREDSRSSDSDGCLHRERVFGEFTRTLTLPTEVDADKVEASFERGVLRVRLPKSEAVKPRKIQVKSASAVNSN